MNKIYYIEYSSTIKFFQNNRTLELIKNEANMIQLERIIKSKKYQFIDLLEN